MDEEVQLQVEMVIYCRKQLAEVETRRNEAGDNPSPGLWQDFVEASRHLDQAEGILWKTCQRISGEVNQARAIIIASLDEYNRLREKMRNFEGLFLANVLRPGAHLKQAIHQRERLQAEYERIRTGIQRFSYASLEDLQADIRRVLVEELPTYSPEEKDEQSQVEQESLPKWDQFSVEEIVEAFSKEELIREFKRVVLPKVHPDTSDTPADVFRTVYEVYKKQDPLLMEAYIVEFRGEHQPVRQPDVLNNLDAMLKQRDYTERLSSRLQHRIENLRREMTSQEMENPNSLTENLKTQQQEILTRIQAEATQILYWREKIEALVQQYRDQHNQNDR